MCFKNELQAAQLCMYVDLNTLAIFFGHIILLLVSKQNVDSHIYHVSGPCSLLLTLNKYVTLLCLNIQITISFSGFLDSCYITLEIYILIQTGTYIYIFFNLMLSPEL